MAVAWIFVLAWPLMASDAGTATREPGPGALAWTLRVHGDRLFVGASLNGIDTDSALLDSGAEMTLVDRQFAREVGLETSGSATARGTGGAEEVTFSEGVVVESAGIRLADRTVAVLSLEGISSRLVGAPVALVVGRELFDAARLEIDIPNGRIAAVDRDAEPRGKRLPMQTHRGLQTIPVSVEGDAPVQADFDLGNGSEVLVGAAYAERAGLLVPERIVGQKSGGGIGGEVVRDLVLLKEIEIAGVVFTDVPAAIDRTETAADFNVGVRILRNFLMTVDFSENALWLDPVQRP